MRPKWISRWAKRWEDTFPECSIACHYSREHQGYILEAYYPTERAWNAIGDWLIWVILLNPSHSPAVRQNRKHFRDESDYTLRSEIDRFKEATR